MDQHSFAPHTRRFSLRSKSWHHTKSETTNIPLTSDHHAASPSLPSLERRMTSILQAFDTERNQQAAFLLALIRPGRKDHPLQASCRCEKAPKPPGDHLPLLGRIIDRRAEEQVLASSTIEADLCKLLLNRS